MRKVKVNRGDIFYANLGEGVGSEQQGERPCLIIQNDVGNMYSPTTIIACLTTKSNKAKLPTHIIITKSDTTEHKARFNDSLVLLEQIRTIDKRRLSERVARLTSHAMLRIDTALETSLSL